MSKNQCPYCDHDNPAESKFCNACGAVLHLAPCPKCGAVNDKSAAQCYRCHAVLSSGGVKALAGPQQVLPPPVTSAAPAAVVVKASARQSKNEPIDVVATTPAKSQRQPVLVMAIVLMAFALASYYAWRQRGAISNREPATAAPAVVTTGAAAGGSIVMTPAPADPRNPPLEKSVAASPPAGATATPATPAAPTVATSPPAEEVARGGRRRPSAPVEKPVQAPVPCTDAIAALGLCTLESTQRRQ